MRKIRQAVSLKKKRYQEDGFDLDLTYITDRIIATGFPSEGKEAIYRNPRWEVQRLMETKHKDHYFMWNLCTERKYPPELFANRVSREFCFDDHQAPKFTIIEPFCRSVDAWLKADPKNIAVIHCKAGKGRTGVMICCYIIYSKMHPDAEDAMRFYAQQRTYDGKGVNIPSQVRYVRYFGRAMKINGQVPYPNQKILLKSIKISPVPPKGMRPIIRISNIDRQEIWNSKNKNIRKYKPEDKEILIELQDGEVPPLADDIHFDFKDKRTTETKKVFKFWINTCFQDEDRLVLTKPELDTVWTDVKHKKWPADLKVEITFTRIGCTAPAESATLRQEAIQAETNWRHSKAFTTDASGSGSGSGSGGGAQGGDIDNSNGNNSSNNNNNNNNDNVDDGSSASSASSVEEDDA